MKVKTIEQKGKTYALLPLKQFEALRAAAESAADNAAYDRAKALGEESFPLALYDAIDAGANPVRTIREYRGLSQTELAETAGMKRPQLSAIENGKKTGSIATLKALAAALRVPLDTLA